MTFGQRVKTIRKELGPSQETFGNHGFVPTAGWIKIENGQRQASEKLIAKLVQWLVAQKHTKAGAGKTLHEELLTLKYMEKTSPFLQGLARKHAQSLPNGAALLAPEAKAKPVVGRPKKKR